MKLSLRQVIEQTEHTTRCLSGGTPHLIPLGIDKFDRVFGGLSPGVFGVLGALDGVGKTTLALYSAFERSKRGLSTAIISTQDPPDVLGVRLLSYMTGINGLKIRRGEHAEVERADLIRAAGRLEENPHIRLFFPNGELGAVLQCLDESMDGDVVDGGHQPDLFYVDYLQNLRIERYGGDRRNEIDLILGRLRDRIHEHRVSMMILSQMRRLPPKRGSEDVPIRMYSRTDLKESGGIGEMARLVLILEKDRIDPGLLHCYVDKSSWGGDNAKASFVRAASGMLLPV